MGGFKSSEKSKFGGRPPGKIDASLNEKLKNVEWGEYKIGDLFKIENTQSFNADKLTIGNEYDYVTRTSINQGVLQQTGFINKENINLSGNWSLGLLQMDFFFRKKPWYAGQFVRKITPKFEITEKNVLFFSSILNKQKPVLLSVLVRHVDETFKNIKIQLPTKNGEIDFEFMESFIAELEAERIAELSAYLSVSGLDNYELSREEENALKDYDDVEWGKYKIGDLFEILSYKKRFDANKVIVNENGKYPYIVRMGSNNGQKGYINENTEYLNDGNTISFGQDTATMYYQEQPYFTGDKIKILKCKDNRFDKKNAQFFLCAMQKPFTTFSWGSSSFNIDTIASQIIQLPTKNGEPDFATMETLISAVQKLVIKDVVLYADRKIKATKKVAAK